MNSTQPITIIGGGLAGLSLGIALRQASVPAIIHEAGSYPRHRVCGEFLSGPGQDVLDRLGLVTGCLAAGGRWAHTVRFATERRLGSLHSLPRPALCLSRHTLDELLANEFVRIGGELQTGVRCTAEPRQPGVVHASGRRPSAAVKGWHWFGVKCHARNVSLNADLELHLGTDSYVGMCRLADDRVNVCGLFRRRRDQEKMNGAPLDWLRCSAGSLRFARLEQAEWLTESLCTVGGLDLRPRRAQHQSEIRLGDALTMIPPFTGNGMSLAIESAELALRPLVAYSRGGSSWEETRVKFAAAIDAACGTRLRWASLLQQTLFLPLAPALMLQLTSGNEFILRRLFALTRGT